MPGLKQTISSAAAIAVLLIAPIKPAAAAAPLLPWALGHAIGAAVRLATLPLAIASSVASSQQPPAQYPSAPGYYGEPENYYPPPNYYAGAPGYHAQPPGYYYAPQPYYRPALAYAPPTQRFYPQSHGYYAPRAPYYGSHGAHVYPRSGGFANHRR